MAKNWTEEEEELIRQRFLAETYGELAEHFGVTTKAMESKIRRMGLKKQEMLAEKADTLEPEPVVPIIEEPPVHEDPSPTPIESIHKLQRRIEVLEETEEVRAERLRATREAAETEKTRREASRAEAPVSKALKKFEAGVKKLMAGKHAEAAKDFQAILDAPPPDLGIVMRTRQYLGAAEAVAQTEPKLETAEDLYNHGVILVNDGDFEAAFGVLDQAAEKAPKDDRISYVRAVAHALNGDDEAALEALAAAIGANDVNRIYARNDVDFTALRTHPDFLELVASPESDTEPD